MINIKDINNYNINTRESFFIINKSKLIEINKKIEENLFKTNRNEYLTFNFYRDYTFLTLETCGENREDINMYKYFKEICDKQILFKEVFKFKTLNEEGELIDDINDINKFIKSNLDIKFIHFTFKKELFDYIIANIDKNIKFKININSEISMFADEVEIPGVSMIYR